MIKIDVKSQSDKYLEMEGVLDKKGNYLVKDTLLIKFVKTEET
jgi:hypothetical protein